MLILIRFARRMIEHPEKTFTVDQDMLNMSSEATTLLFEIGCEQVSMLVRTHIGIFRCECQFLAIFRY
jgi:hypothetical protein